MFFKIFYQVKKIIFKLIFLFLTSISFTQAFNYNKLSVDVNSGFVKPLYPFTQGYYTNFLGPVNIDIGVRYMLNQRFGIKPEFSYNLFKNDEFGKNDTSLVFRSNYFRYSVVGITNLGYLMNFRYATSKVGLLLHTGFGFSTLSSDKTDKKKKWTNDYSDIMLSFSLGLIPQYKINDHLAFNLDLKMISHLSQTFAFDMMSSVKKDGFDGIVLNISGGISYYIGSKGNHIDWIKE